MIALSFLRSALLITAKPPCNQVTETCSGVCRLCSQRQHTSPLRKATEQGATETGDWIVCLFGNRNLSLTDRESNNIN